MGLNPMVHRKASRSRKTFEKGVRFDVETAAQLHELARVNERTLSAEVRVLVRNAHDARFDGEPPDVDAYLADTEKRAGGG